MLNTLTSASRCEGQHLYSLPLYVQSPYKVTLAVQLCEGAWQAAHQLYVKWATMMAHTGADRRNTPHGTALSAQAKQLRLRFQAVSAAPLHDSLHPAEKRNGPYAAYAADAWACAGVSKGSWVGKTLPRIREGCACLQQRVRRMAAALAHQGRPVLA